MRLARFRAPTGEARVGVVDGDEVVDVSRAGTEPVPHLPAALGADGGIDALAARTAGAERFPLDDVVLLAPVPRPPKFLAIGLNYADHAAETGREPPDFPLFFNKAPTCVVGPGDAIHVPRVSSMVDLEGELAVVIGRRCRHVPATRAAAVVAGYTIVNDVSVRDWQRRSPTMTLGKSFDTHGPMGPWIVTTDELDPHHLAIRSWRNDVLMQDGTTADMIVDCWTQIETLSTVCTLEPGDVIATGTPAGVGVARTPPVFLEAGDTVRIEIEGIGVLENPVVDEPDTAAGW